MTRTHCRIRVHADHRKAHFGLLISPEVMGCTASTLGIPKAWKGGGGGAIYVFKNWKFRVGEAGSSYMKFPPRWGYGHILDPDTNKAHIHRAHIID